MSKPAKARKPVKAGGKPTKKQQTTLKGNLKKLGYDDATLAAIVVDGDDLGTMADNLILTQRNAPRA